MQMDDTTAKSRRERAPKTGLRLMVFDDTCRGAKYPIGLTHSWIAGALLYKSAGQLDATYGSTSWEQALKWLASFDEPIAEIQYWGHGKWGRMMIDRDRFDAENLKLTHPHAKYLDAIRDQLTPGAMFWIRTCETFGATVGHDFAQRLSDRLGCATAGHTFIIGPWQSGLHVLYPGQTPHWDPAEGIQEGTVDEPQKAYWSGARQPNTVTCLHMRIPTKLL